jgi:hypothetical protein
MAIVLAIEPDRRQAAHLSAIVRQQVGADLVIADTTEGALDAIGDRVPDLVLVPALLSPQDDAALAAALRVIAAAAHVRTLTIPVLANGTKRTSGGGLLAKWRKRGAESPEPDGCEPAVFGEQISAYLREAAAERAQIEDDLLDDEPAPVLHAYTPATNPGTELRQQIPVPPVPMVEAYEPAPIFRSDLEVRPERRTLRFDLEVRPQGPTIDSDPEPALQPMQLWASEPIEESAIEEPEETLIDLSDELEELGDAEAEGERFDGEPVGVYTISADEDAPDVEAFDLLPAILEAETDSAAEPARVQAEPAIAEPVFAEPVCAEPMFAESIPTKPMFDEPMFVETAAVEPAAIEPAFAEPAFAATASVEPAVLEPVFAEPMLVEPAEPPRADIASWVPTYLSPGRMWPVLEGVPAEMPVARTEQPDWIELVASLRQDLERRRTDPAAAAADPIAARPSDGAHAGAHLLVKRPRPQAKKAKPVQDEWGFFDPEQCGFSTLLAKLDEITEQP